ncbi:MAG: hypothetical protein HKO66_11410 [Saprospiraceae bacterium]|nr:hypothetical protein [Bacteroidia bacterium]NNE16778.1 hypothetical protein [Saprospiraceae bacterium]NNL92834.1 hypothetical protein [Saprospiraceae bacterium]
MKNIILLLTMLITTTLFAQDAKNGLEASVSYGFGKDNLAVQTVAFKYKRNIGLGLEIFVSNSISKGGVSLQHLINETAYNSLRESETIQQYEGISNGFLGTYFHMNSISIGIKKSIQLTPKFDLGIALATNYSSISRSELTNITYDGSGQLIFDDMREKYASYNRLGAQVTLNLGYQVNKHLNIGLQISYLSNPQLFSPGIFGSVTF